MVEITEYDHSISHDHVNMSKFLRIYIEITKYWDYGYELFADWNDGTVAIVPVVPGKALSLSHNYTNVAMSKINYAEKPRFYIRKIRHKPGEDCLF